MYTKFLVVSLLFFVTKSFCCFTFIGTRSHCNAEFNCLETEDLVWATDSSKCLLFRNNCFLFKENCRRISQNMRVLSIISKESCQLLCSDIICPFQLEPICASYDGEPASFSNNCTLESTNCKDGKPYTYMYAGICKFNNDDDS